jgi:apolipoprotein N-acyltransferase
VPIPTRWPLVGTLSPALATGGLLWLCYFPANLGWLAWVALVPLLTLVNSHARPRTIYLCAWAGGSVFFWPAIQWMRVADYRMYFTWIGLSIYCSLYFPFAIYLIRLLIRRRALPFIVTVPVVWTALEFCRSYFGTGFPWYLLAHSQHDYLPLIQIADVTGAWGVTFLIAAVNAFLCAIVLAGLGRPVASRRGLWVGGATVVLAFAAVWGYGGWRMGGAQFSLGPTVALVQGNLPQYLRNNPTTGESIWHHYAGLCDVAARSKPDLIVTPETSVPLWWSEKWPNGLTDETKKTAREVSQLFHVPVLLGLNSVVRTSDQVERKYNSAVLVNGAGEPTGRYDKIHRVPFGEYVPLRDWLPFMNWLAPYDFDYSVSPGASATRFTIPSRDPGRTSNTFGVVICYEDTDPELTRPYANAFLSESPTQATKNGTPGMVERPMGADGRPAADFILNISNDGWFEGTSEHEQHLAICRFRAVECRRPVARAVNMGISAVIDGNGRVLEPQPLSQYKIASGVGPEPVVAGVWQVTPESASMPPHRWEEFKKVACVVLATLPLDGRSSVYARFGDWLPWACWGAFGVSLVRSRRKPAAEGVR